MIHYAYDAYYGDLDIIMSPCLSWKSTLIERFFNKYNGSYVTVPAFNVNGAAYQFVEAINNPLYYQEGNIEFIHADMYVMLPQNLNGLDALASYAEFLKAAGVHQECAAAHRLAGSRQRLARNHHVGVSRA